MIIGIYDGERKIGERYEGGMDKLTPKLNAERRELNLRDQKRFREESFAQVIYATTPDGSFWKTTNGMSVRITKEEYDSRQ